MRLPRQLTQAFWPLSAIMQILFKRRSYFREMGWLTSKSKGYPCDNDGKPLPWMNYPIIYLLKERLDKKHSMFEYGSGFSTQFFAERVADITSVEYNADWFEKVKTMVPNNAALLFQTQDINGDYCRTIIKTKKKYDIILVDGRDRVNCVKIALDCLKDKGVLILDDSQREIYSEAHTYAEEKGFKKLDLEGVKPTGYKNDRSTIFYKTPNCFNI